MDSAGTYYFVNVQEPDGKQYDVGPFPEGIDPFKHGSAAIDWIYRQVGILKVNEPNESLIKHEWYYKERDSGFSNPEVRVKVEISGYLFEIHELQSPSFKNVIDARMERSIGGAK